MCYRGNGNLPFNRETLLDTQDPLQEASWPNGSYSPHQDAPCRLQLHPLLLAPGLLLEKEMDFRVHISEDLTQTSTSRSEVLFQSPDQESIISQNPSGSSTFIAHMHIISYSYYRSNRPSRTFYNCYLHLCLASSFLSSVLLLWWCYCSSLIIWFLFAFYSFLCCRLGREQGRNFVVKETCFLLYK